MRIDTDTHGAYRACMDKLKQIWNSPAALSADLGLPYTTVHSWFLRDSIPASRDLDLIAAAKRRGHKLTLEDLARSRCKRDQPVDAIRVVQAAPAQKGKRGAQV